MPTVRIRTQHSVGPLKPMHAVNNGPHVTRGDQSRGNEKTYRAAGIPYARTHDAAFYAKYGGEHTVDIYAVFPDFDADQNDPASYDFACTDHYLNEIRQAGTRVFYRLGSKIEHGVKKYHIFPPKDFQKWAEICEHIIAHYTAGWANGFEWDIDYWEIWNEPDLDPDDAPVSARRNWTGTAEEFYRFYITAATHLKKRFPHLKIGGPAMAMWNGGVWMENFLKALTANGRAPLDFFSWHTYTADPRKISGRAGDVRRMLDRYGYTATENILDEWNYVRGWSDEFIYSVESIIGAKGAAFTAACMIEGQDSPLDMLMYYDARPCVFNGMFDFYTMRPLKGYYPFLFFSGLYRIGTQVETACDDGDIRAIAAANGEHVRVMVSYFAEDDSATAKTVAFSTDRPGTYRCTRIDGTRMLEVTELTVDETGTCKITLEPQTVLSLELDA